MPLPFYLVGPTAVGKSSLAVRIAERCGAEIVGADAFQIYRGLDVLTAKPSPEQLGRVPHYLVGMLSLAAEYNVARYIEDAQGCLAKIGAKGKPVIVVGGSGLYVRALTHGLSHLPPSKPELRVELETQGLPALIARLSASDPDAAAAIDTKNKRRLVRAIEICEATGQPWSATRARWNDSIAPPGSTHGLLLTRERAELNVRIAQRVGSMNAERLLDEVRAAQQEDFSITASKIIGLAEVQAHLRGVVTLDSCLARIELATRQYAKRQMTWFRNKSDFWSVDLTQTSAEEVVEMAVATIESGRGG